MAEDTEPSWTSAVVRHALLALMGFVVWWGQDAIREQREALATLTTRQVEAYRRLENLEHLASGLKEAMGKVEGAQRTWEQATYDMRNIAQELRFELKLIDHRYMELRKIMRALHPGAFEPMLE